MSTESPDETIARLTESNRRLANQIVGYGDRMQQTVAGIVKTAKVEALRELSDWLESMASGYLRGSGQLLAGRDIIAQIRARADNLEAS